MKNKKINEKNLLTQLREIRDEISHDIQDMTLLPLKEYLDKKDTMRPYAIWQK